MQSQGRTSTSRILSRLLLMNSTVYRTGKIQEKILNIVLFTLTFMILFSIGNPDHASAQSGPPSSLPRLSLADFQYAGAFRLPASPFGVSELNYSQGPIEYNPANNSLFIVGHAHQQALAEFGIPNLVQSTTLSQLTMADNPLQNFSTVLNRVSGGNPQLIDRIGGMEVVSGPNGPELLVNAYEYYDAPGDNSTRTH